MFLEESYKLKEAGCSFAGVEWFVFSVTMPPDCVVAKVSCSVPADAFGNSAECADTLELMLVMADGQMGNSSELGYSDTLRFDSDIEVEAELLRIAAHKVAGGAKEEEEEDLSPEETIAYLRDQLARSRENEAKLRRKVEAQVEAVALAEREMRIVLAKAKDIDARARQSMALSMDAIKRCEKQEAKCSELVGRAEHAKRMYEEQTEGALELAIRVSALEAQTKKRVKTAR